MKRILLIICLSFLAISCKTGNDKPFIEKIQGDWITDLYEMASGSRHVIFNFEDSLCTAIGAWDPYRSFDIKGDTLTIYQPLQKDTAKQTKTNYCKFKILKLDDDSLVMSSGDIVTSALFEYYKGLNPKRIALHKIKEKNKISPSKITFFSSKCFGNCPSFTIEIDSSRKVIFTGHSDAEIEGRYTGTISSRQYQLLLLKIWKLPIENIKSSYNAGWKDDQSCSIDISYDNKKLHSSVYGYDKEPIELRILIQKFFKLYSQLELKKDPAGEKDKK
jgi:hypothetical protein